MTRSAWTLCEQMALIVGVASAFSIVFALLFGWLKPKQWVQRRFWLTIMLGAIEVPLQVFIWLNALVWLVDITWYTFGWWDWSHHFSKWQYLILLISISWVLLNVKEAIEHVIRENRHFRQKSSLEKATADAIGRLASVAILAIAGLMGLQIVGIPIESVLAITAVGAAGIAWASTDVVKNFFGGLMVHLTRPFAIGDWINSPEKEIEGMVEEIGWYQTRIRTFDKQPLYAPNGLFSSIVIRNPSRMSHRKIVTDIKLGYEELDQIPIIVEEINRLLQEIPGIDQTQPAGAHCNALHADGIGINVDCFTNTMDWMEWRAIEQEVLLGIAEILRKNKR